MRQAQEGGTTARRIEMLRGALVLVLAPLVRDSTHAPNALSSRNAVTLLSRAAYRSATACRLRTARACRARVGEARSGQAAAPWGAEPLNPTAKEGAVLASRPLRLPAPRPPGKLAPCEPS